MQIILLILFVAGYILVGYSAFNIMAKLSLIFPFATQSRWWWTKRLPLLGLGLLFMAVGQPLIFSLPGIMIIIGCQIWLDYCIKNKIHG